MSSSFYVVFSNIPEIIIMLRKTAPKLWFKGTKVGGQNDDWQSYTSAKQVELRFCMSACKQPGLSVRNRNSPSKSYEYHT